MVMAMGIREVQNVAPAYDSATNKRRPRRTPRGTVCGSPSFGHQREFPEANPGAYSWNCLRSWLESLAFGSPAARLAYAEGRARPSAKAIDVHELVGNVMAEFGDSEDSD